MIRTQMFLKGYMAKEAVSLQQGVKLLKGMPQAGAAIEHALIPAERNLPMLRRSLQRMRPGKTTVTAEVMPDAALRQLKGTPPAAVESAAAEIPKQSPEAAAYSSGVLDSSSSADHAAAAFTPDEVTSADQRTRLQKLLAWFRNNKGKTSFTGGLAAGGGIGYGLFGRDNSRKEPAESTVV